jgi:hypothetical protein
MRPETFVLGLGFLLALLFGWAFRALPAERWQFIGCLLSEKKPDGGWHGTNLSYYGFFTATAYLLAATLFFVLAKALALPSAAIGVLLGAILAVCVPASRLIAAWVEGKTNTLTVGGASFTGLIAAPWISEILRQVPAGPLRVTAPVMALLAAVSIAYALGEGVGRLACISFGCCYGKPLAAAPSWLRRLFRGRAFVFFGPTKKIAYAHRLEGREVIPVQALSAVVLTVAGLLGCYAFLQGFYAAAFLGTLVASQGWRVLSECLRADHRGGGKITAYQVMALLSIGYALLLLAIFPEAGGIPDLAAALASLWDPAVLLLFQGLWVAVFLHTGRSRVTDATVRLHVLPDRI